MHQTLYIVESLQCVLLGVPAIEALGVINLLMLLKINSTCIRSSLLAWA